MSYQKLVVAGNLGGDPELRYLQSGQGVTNFSLATNRVYNNSNGERVEEVTWFRVSVWGRQAEACNQYLKKGSKVLIEGRLNPDRETGGPRVYQRPDGSYGAQFEITADRVVFMDSRPSQGGGGYQGGGGAGQQIGEDDELPF